MSSPAKTPLNHLLSKDHYLQLCQARGMFPPAAHMNAPGPTTVTFQKRGSPAKGFPLCELLNIQHAGMLEDANNGEIRAFHDAGIPEIMLVVWAPERRSGPWFHQFRSIPTASPMVRLTTKAALAHLIAAEYFAVCNEANRRGASHEGYPELQVEGLSLISLRRICGNVYQAELAPSAGRRTF